MYKLQNQLVEGKKVAELLLCVCVCVCVIYNVLVLGV